MVYGMYLKSIQLEIRLVYIRYSAHLNTLQVESPIANVSTTAGANLAKFSGKGDTSSASIMVEFFA